jgi:mono/diheme cytochrome c family protein
MFPTSRINRALLIALAAATLAFTSAGSQPKEGASAATSEPLRPLSAGVTPASPEARDAANSIFAERCAVCHGDDGGGAGPGAANLNPKPQNFRSHKWQKSMSDDQIAKIIVNGGSSVGLSASMAANPDLEGQPDVVAALVERVRKFGK